MEKYILLIILSAFVIYLFCRKKDLIEGIPDGAVADAVRGGLRDAGHEVTDAELRHIIAGMGGDLNSMTDTQIRELVQRSDTTISHADAQHSLRDLLNRRNGTPLVESSESTAVGAGRDAAETEEAAVMTQARNEAGMAAKNAPNDAPSPGLIQRLMAGASEEEKAAMKTNKALKKYGKIQEDANQFTNKMAESSAGTRKLDEKGFKVEDGKIKRRSGIHKDREITPKERRKLYEEFDEGVGDGAEYVTRTSGVSRELEEKVESKLTRLREAGGNHPYIALGLGVIGVILFNRESEEDCIATCTSGEADDDWKKNHGVEDTYSENCPGDTCADFCSASGEGECSVRQRNEASVSEITTTILGAAGEGLDAVLGELWKILAGIGAIPFAIVCCIFISIPVVMIIYSMITSKVSSVKQSILNTGGIKGDVIRKGAEIYSGGGNLKKLNSPKVIILIVFFIFIVYNGRRK